MHNQPQLAGKRILIVLPGLELGGAERQAIYLAQHLKSLGCDVRVCGHFGPGLAATRCEEMGIPWSIHYFRWPCRKSSLPRVAWGLLKFFLALWKNRPDIILSYCSWANISSGLTWRWSPAKVFVWGQRDCDSPGDALQRFAYRKASGVICNAEHEVDYLRRTLGESFAPLYIVHNGIDLEPCRKTSTEWRGDLKINQNNTVAVMVANFRFQKDHKTLLYAWSKVLANHPAGKARPRLLLAGAPQESYNVIKKLVDSLALRDSVFFLGQITDISGLLAACDIGVLSTPNEGLPNAVIEYMASGLPVVATDLPSTREVLGEEFKQQFCKPGDPESLAERLQVLLDNSKLRQNLGARNRQRAESVFSIDKMCKKTVGIIESLLEKNAVHKRTILTG